MFTEEYNTYDIRKEQPINMHWIDKDMPMKMLV